MRQRTFHKNNPRCGPKCVRVGRVCAVGGTEPRRALSDNEGKRAAAAALPFSAEQFGIVLLAFSL